MAINKVIYGGTTLIDLSGDSLASASQLIQGVTAHDRTGALITGTATGGGGTGGNVWQDQDGYVHLDDEGSTPITVESLSVTQNGTYTAPTGKAYTPVTVNVSGGGGLEYETGTWTPSEDVAGAWISFANTHNSAPVFYAIFVADGIGSTTSGDNLGVTYFNNGQFCGEGAWVTSSGTTIQYAAVLATYKNTATAASYTSYRPVIPYTDQGDTGTNYSRYWTKETGIRAYSGSDSRYWRSDRTYKWIAVWASTT